MIRETVGGTCFGLVHGINSVTKSCNLSPFRASETPHDTPQAGGACSQVSRGNHSSSNNWLMNQYFSSYLSVRLIARREGTMHVSLGAISGGPTRTILSH